MTTSPVTLILPMIFVALCGFLAAKRQLFTHDQIRGFSQFIVMVGVPAMLISALSKQAITSVIQPVFLFSYLGVTLTGGVLTWLIGRFLLNASLSQGATMFLGSVLPNTIIIGYPVALELFGERAVPLFVMVMLVENVVLIPLALVLFEHSIANESEHSLGKQLSKRVLGNPIVISMAVGILLSVIGVQVPNVIDKGLSLFGQTISGLALFVIGAMMARATLSDFSSRTLLTVFMKLFAAPAGALLLVYLLKPADPVVATAIVLFVASPCFSLLPSFAQQYGQGEFGAGIQATATATGIATLPIVLLLIV